MAGCVIGIIILITILIVYNRVSWPVNIVKIPAGRSTREWNVISDFDNKKDAAELLARVNSTTIEFMRYLKKKYHIDETDDVISSENDEHQRIVNLPNDIYNIVDHMLDNYNPDVFYENDPRYTSETSYTLNKGAAMYICLRQKDDPSKLIDEDLLLFAHLHEASHIANYRGWEHEMDFWQTFKFILHEAVLAGIYKPVDYSKNPVVFCGLTVNFNSLFDDTIPNLWEKTK